MSELNFKEQIAQVIQTYHKSYSDCEVEEIFNIFKGHLEDAFGPEKFKAICNESVNYGRIKK